MMDEKNGGVMEYEMNSVRVCRCVGIVEREEGQSWFCHYHTHH